MPRRSRAAVNAATCELAYRAGSAAVDSLQAKQRPSSPAHLHPPRAAAHGCVVGDEGVHQLCWEKTLTG